MPTKRTPQNGRERLEEAMAMLIQCEVAFASRLSATEARFAPMDERFARIERDLATILHILSEHSRLLERLPEAICHKLGFKADQ